MFVIPLVTESMKDNHQQRVREIEERHMMHNRSLTD